MAIFPYPDDLRTVTLVLRDATPSLAQPVAFSPQRRAPRLTGTLTSSGARCISPTPLRQSTLKWSFPRTNQVLTSSMAQRPTAALMKPLECKQVRLVRRPRCPRHCRSHQWLKSHLQLFCRSYAYADCYINGNGYRVQLQPRLRRHPQDRCRLRLRLQPRLRLRLRLRLREHRQRRLRARRVVPDDHRLL